MGRKRGDVGRFQIRCTFFLLLSFLLTCRVVQCGDSNDVNKDPENEVPIVHASTHHKTKSKVTTEATKQSEEEKKDEQKKDDDKSNPVISNKTSNDIVPQVDTVQNVTKPDSGEVTKPATEENTGQTAIDGEKIITDQENSVPDTKKATNIPDEADAQKSEADDTKQKGEASEGIEKDSETIDQTESKAESKTESENQNNPDHEDDSTPKDTSKNGDDTKANATTVTNNTAPDSTTEQNKLKPDSGKVNTTDLTSPSLSDQSTKADDHPKKYFPTLTPNTVDPDGSNFSFFRLFILTTVVFVVAYVGYYYRHKLKRHFCNNGKEIYYQPLRTMQHNAVD